MTFRLAGSLPPTFIRELREKFGRIYSDPKSLSIDKEMINNQMARYFDQFDEYLHQSTGNSIRLDEEDIASVVSRKLKEFDGLYFHLMAFTIMPNHVHLLLDFSCQICDERGLLSNETPSGYKQLDQVMKLIKGGTAFQINKYLGRSGQVWARESYDRVVRDPGERGNVIRYILNNPVKAGLVSSWEEWPHTYLQEG